MSRENRSSCIRDEDQAVTVCIWDIWFLLYLQSMQFVIPMKSLLTLEYRWLQDVFQVPIVIQLTGRHPSVRCGRKCQLMNSILDDEKFLFKHELKPEQTKAFSRLNARDIIACGFDLEKTFIFSDYEFMGGPFYQNVSRVSRQITYNQVKATFGFTES